MLSGLPKTIGEAKPISAEAAQKESVNDRFFWYCKNVKYFIKDGEERLGFGHADVRNFRDYLREVKQSGNQTEYLALLQFIGNQRSVGDDKFEGLGYGFEKSQLKLNLDELASVLRAQELKKIVAGEQIPIDPTDIENLGKNVRLLLDVMANKNEIGGEEVMEKAMKLILSCLNEREEWGKSGIKEECRDFIEKLFYGYINALEVEHKENELRKNIDRTNLVGPWKYQLERLMEALTNNIKHFRGLICDELLRKLNLSPSTAGTNFLKMFFQTTIDFLPAREENRRAFELLLNKFALNEKILTALRQIEDPQQRFEEAKKVGETVGADIILDHIYELNLPEGQEEKLLEAMAEVDPESVLHHARYIDFKSLNNHHELYSMLIETTVGGKKAMIVRGLNPKQNIIEQLSAENFTEEFIEKYLLPICREQGIGLLLCPLHNHGALTNRPSVEEYLKKKYSEARRVKLDETIDFNGYNITDSCVVLREVK